MEEQTKYDEIRVKLGSRLRKTGRHPFLFVGSGIPMRYAELPNWESLLRGICARISDNPFALERYDNEVSGTGKFERYPAIATLMGEKTSIALLSPIHRSKGSGMSISTSWKAGTSAFKLFIARYLDTYEPTLLHEELSVLRAASNKISGVITTELRPLHRRIVPRLQNLRRPKRAAPLRYIRSGGDIQNPRVG